MLSKRGALEPRHLRIALKALNAPTGQEALFLNTSGSGIPPTELWQLSQLKPASCGRSSETALRPG